MGKKDKELKKAANAAVSAATSSKKSQISQEQINKAEDFKKRGNDYFKENKFNQALVAYSSAIAINSESAIYHANRAAAYIHLENYIEALRDASKAIDIDPTYVKGYFRRATACFALRKFKEAQRDLKMVCSIAPSDKDAAEKFRQCSEELKRQDQEIVLKTRYNGRICENFKLEDISVENTYTGARFDGNITQEFIDQMTADYVNQRPLHKKYAMKLIIEAKKLLSSLPTVVDITVPEGNKITVCGDTHGQFYDLMNIFKINGKPSESNPYLFNGDFVDRGSFSLEIILTLFAYKILYPNHMHLTRGNHESRMLNMSYGFAGEIKHKYDSDIMFETFQETFNWLPLAMLLNNKVLVLHGGLFGRDGVTLNDLRAINRNQDIPESGDMCDALWSDPMISAGKVPSHRGCGVRFGPDVTEKFLAENNLSLIVRSHEAKEEGYEVLHNNKLITIFSAPNYCDQLGNKGAFIRFKADMKPEFVQFNAVPHPFCQNYLPSFMF